MPPTKKKNENTKRSVKMKRSRQPLISKRSSISIKTLPDILSQQIITRSKAKLLFQIKENFHVHNTQLSLKEHEIDMVSLHSKKSPIIKYPNNEIQKKEQTELELETITRQTNNEKKISYKTNVEEDKITDSSSKSDVSLCNYPTLVTDPRYLTRHQRDISLPNILVSSHSKQMKEIVKGKIYEDLSKSSDNSQDLSSKKLTCYNKISETENNVSKSVQQICASQKKLKKISENRKNEDATETNVHLLEQSSKKLIANDNDNESKRAISIACEQVCASQQKLKKRSRQGRHECECEKSNISIALVEEAKINCTKNEAESSGELQEHSSRKLVQLNKDTASDRMPTINGGQVCASLQKLKKNSKIGRNDYEIKISTSLDKEAKSDGSENRIQLREELQEQFSKYLNSNNKVSTSDRARSMGSEEEIASQQNFKQNSKKGSNEYEKIKISTSLYEIAKNSCVDNGTESKEFHEQSSKNLIADENKDIESDRRSQICEQIDDPHQKLPHKTKTQSNSTLKNDGCSTLQSGSMPKDEGNSTSIEQKCTPQHLKKRSRKRRIGDLESNISLHAVKKTKRKSTESSTELHDNSLVSLTEKLISLSTDAKSSNQQSSSLESIFTPSQNQQKRGRRKKIFSGNDIPSQIGSNNEKVSLSTSDLSLTTNISSCKQSTKKIILNKDSDNDCLITKSIPKSPNTQRKRSTKPREDLKVRSISASLPLNQAQEEAKDQVVVNSTVSLNQLSKELTPLKQCTDIQQLAAVSSITNGALKQATFQKSSGNMINNSSLRSGTGDKELVEDGEHLQNVKYNVQSISNNDTEDITLEEDISSNVSGFVRQELWKKKHLYNMQQDIVTMENRKLSTFNTMFSSICKTFFNKGKEED